MLILPLTSAPYTTLRRRQDEDDEEKDDEEEEDGTVSSQDSTHNEMNACLRWRREEGT
jgi:hypothetical protein